MTARPNTNRRPLNGPFHASISTSSVTLHAKILSTSALASRGFVPPDASAAGELVLHITFAHSALVYFAALPSLTPREIAGRLARALEGLDKRSIKPDRLVSDYESFWRSDEIAALLHARGITHILKSPRRTPDVPRPNPEKTPWLH